MFTQVNGMSGTRVYKKNGVSGGSTDIDPEPEGKQNGTAPLQDAKEK